MPFTGEINIQNQFIKDYFCDNKDGLHYQCVSANTVSRDGYYFIESDLKQFLSETSFNAKQWQKAVRNYHNDSEALFQDLKDEISKRIASSTNIATFFRANKKLNFAGAEFVLFAISGSELNGDTEFEQNIFSIVFELTVDLVYEGTKLYHFRPDYTFFLNGIYFGYTELKSNWQNQSSRKNGRTKVMGDYRNAVAEYVKIVGSNDTSNAVRKQFLYFFEKAISITTTDIEQTYIIRNISETLPFIRKAINTKKDFNEYEREAETRFKPYPLINPNASSLQRFDEVMKALYSKKMIEKEILYYNFFEYEYVKDKKGNKVLKNNVATLISPRPKQKFGTDKIMARIPEFLAHENEPDYYINKMVEELRAHHVNETDIEKRVEQRRKFQNNKNIYSLLLQYAAGFGKSNIIGWTALQLKDLRDDKNAYVYDKILLITDRLQLRDQLDSMLRNMNIEKSLFKEITCPKELQEGLLNSMRILDINIQKFASNNIFDKEAMKQLASMRVCFIIDEIHRSNSGTQHDDMINLFDILQAQFDNDDDYKSKRTKKNLIIGFTATPTDNALARFGEYCTFQEAGKQWVPFDAYTMREAIEDGYILDPTQNIIPVSAKMLFYKEDDGNTDKRYIARKEDIYSNEDRIRAISKFIAKQLCERVYPKIGRTAKAMLAVTSIPNAIKYRHILEEEYNNFIDENPQHEEFREAPIYIVYSDSQGQQSASSLNNGLTEEKVLDEFKICKNGIIIVVDKLQTGFDEKKLHSLFLDKEISGINAIQTISRVDRKCYGKKECFIYDMSHNNVNKAQINEAFKHFSDVVISDFNPFVEEKDMIEAYGVLSKHILYTTHFADFIKAKQNGDGVKILEIEESFRTYIQNAMAAAEIIRKNDPNFIDEAEQTKDTVNHYYLCLGKLEFVIDIDAKYKDKDFLDFWKHYCTIYNFIVPKGDAAEPIEIYYDNTIGIASIEPEDKPEPEHKPKGTKKKKGHHDPFNLDAFLAKLNENEEKKEEQIQQFSEQVKKFYNFIIDNPRDGARFIAKLNSDGQSFTAEDILKDFKLLYNKYKLLHKNDIDPLFKTYNDSSLDALLENFRNYLVNPEIVFYKDGSDEEEN